MTSPFHFEAADMGRCLPELGDGLCAQLHELVRQPSQERAEVVANNLRNAAGFLLHYAEKLGREGTR